MITRRFLASVGLAAAAIGLAAPAQAAVTVNSGGVTITTNADGQITQAFDNTYFATFAKGSCDFLFDNCSTSAFAFVSEQKARDAASWLLSLVLTDQSFGGFDTDPKLVFGCTSGSVCDILIPYGIVSGGNKGNIVLTVDTMNNKTELKDGIGLDTVPHDSQREYAVFTPNYEPPIQSSVPEPGTWLLMIAGFGIAGAGLRRRTAKVVRRVSFA